MDANLKINNSMFKKKKNGKSLILIKGESGKWNDSKKLEVFVIIKDKY